jgi:sugar transferase EpsL
VDVSKLCRSGDMVKRLLDLWCALCLMLILSPVLVALSLLVRIKMGSPVIFKQLRPGLNEKLFYIYKFRTMTDKRDENGQLIPEHLRITKFGLFLRKSSLDELPQLFNVVKGDLSLVGPRPLLVEYLSLYTPEQARRHQVRPGITGWAQINGRNAITWEEKFALDVWYVNNRSFLLDCKILLLTVIKVLRHDGIGIEDRYKVSDFREEKDNIDESV